MKDIPYKPKLLLIFIVFQILYGCTGHPTQLSEPLQEMSIPTPTSKDRGLRTPTQKPTLIFADTPKPTFTITTSPEPTSTPTSPSLTSEQIQAWILEQMVNPVCDLPCWWGIIPGTTTWEDAKKMLSPYASSIGEYEMDDGLSTGVWFHSPPEEVTEFALTLGFAVHESVISNIGVTGIEKMRAYQLPELMHKYGVPGQIWVYGYSGSANDTGPRDIGFYPYFPDKNIIVYFTAPRGEVRDGYLYNCLRNTPHLQLGKPGEYESYDEVAEQIGGGLQFPVKPISEALGMNVETFYEMYKDTTEDICFETPIELWQWGETTPEP